MAGGGEVYVQCFIYLPYPSFCDQHLLNQPSFMPHPATTHLNFLFLDWHQLMEMWKLNKNAPGIIIYKQSVKQSVSLWRNTESHQC